MLILLLCFTIICSVFESALSTLPPYLTDEDFLNAKLIGHNYSNRSAIIPNNDYTTTKSRTDIWRHNTPWPSAIVPYSLNSNLDSNDRAQITLAITHIQERTCILFVPKQGSESRSLEILRDDKVCGVAGLCGNDARFGGSCRNWNVMVHELLHSLCFMHEHERIDRDEWLTLPQGCTPGKNTPNNYYKQELLYDYRSCTSYGCKNDDCMQPKLPGVKACGCGNSGLTPLDVDKVNALYDCRGCRGYRWRPGNNAKNPFPGGYDLDKSPFYPCRAYHESGDIVPGKGQPGSWCLISYGGRELVVTDKFEILTNGNNANLKWVRRNGGPIPNGAIKGGRTEYLDILYICRCSSVSGYDTVIPGKVHLSSYTYCFVPFGGREHACDNYEILVCD